MEKLMGWMIKRTEEEIFSPSADLYSSFLLPSAYDTAWVAMVPHAERPHRPRFPECLEWILTNQRDGGFWGDLAAADTMERLSATLACLVALKTWNVGHSNIDQGLKFLHANTEELLLKRENGSSNFPRWFAIVFPGMLELAREKGLEVGFMMEVAQDVFSQRERVLTTKESRIGRLLPPLDLYLEALPASQKAKILESGNWNEEGLLLHQSPSAIACAFMITGKKGCMDLLETMVERCGQRGVPHISPVDEDLIKLCLVDHLERLGCAEHFTKDIKDVMDHTYRKWIIEEEISQERHGHFQIYKDSLAFRLLRMHNYRVSPRRFCWFVHDDEMLHNIEDGCDATFLGAMLSVYRATHLTFPQESELEEARVFCGKILQNSLTCKRVPFQHDLQNEIEHELQLPWLARIDHLEHRSYIERNDNYLVWLGKISSSRLSFSTSSAQCQLARSNFSIRQLVYNAELQELKRWVKDVGLYDIGFGREKTAYTYFAAAGTSCQPFISDVRKVIAKCAILTTVADDFFDEKGSLDELCSLTKAVQRWDGEGLYSHGKIIFNALDNIVRDVTSKSFDQQGHDIKKILQAFWRETFESWLKEAEWSRRRHAPPIDEYLNVGMISIAIQAMILPACYLTSPKLPTYSPSSDYSLITKLLMVISRLLNDIQSYQKEERDGKFNMVSLYLKENPEADVEDAVTYISNMLDRKTQEFLELLKSDGDTDIPKEWKELHLSCLKSFKMFFNSTNAFDSPTALLQNISMAIYEPLQGDAELPPVHPSTPYLFGSKEDISLVPSRFNDRKGEKVLLKARGQPQVLNFSTLREAVPFQIRPSLGHHRHLKMKRSHTILHPSSSTVFNMSKTNLCPMVWK